MKEVKVSVELKAQNKVIVKNDKGLMWSYDIKDNEARPIYMVSSIITSMLCTTIIEVMNQKFGNKIQFKLSFK